ncbi:class I SAM-dependent methyltransferase [Desulfogranum japonicum]|uniref:class I SAM-dependent methyltransferase n=1 Tax=Desulfogranum japonicum TaxID=231447 RepID=UPI0004909D34|nr:class I SAM-dependent methyltransferase [Desulfogranum japonicum]
MNSHKLEHKFIEEIENFTFSQERLEQTLQMIPDTGRLLEIGICFRETIDFYREKFHGDCYGVDISRKIIKNRSIDFTEAKVCDVSTEDIPWENNFFDVIVCNEVIEHVYNTDNMLAEIHRVLAETGILIISTPNLASFINRIFLLFGLQPLCTEVSTQSTHYGNFLRQKLVPAGHIRNFTYKALADLLEESGFIITTQCCTSISSKKLVSCLENLAGKIHVSLGSNIILGCMKK